MSTHELLLLVIGVVCGLVPALAWRLVVLAREMKALRALVSGETGQRSAEAPLESTSEAGRAPATNGEGRLPRDYPAYRDQLEIRRAAERILKQRHEAARMASQGTPS